MAKDQTYFQEGVNAFWDGELLEDPPYHPKDTRGLDWVAGWKSAQKDEADGLDRNGNSVSMFDLDPKEPFEEELRLERTLQSLDHDDEDGEAQAFNEAVRELDYYGH